MLVDEVVIVCASEVDDELSELVSIGVNVLVAESAPLPLVAVVAAEVGSALEPSDMAVVSVSDPSVPAHAAASKSARKPLPTA